MNLSQSFNGLGWILGPLVGGMLIFGGAEDDPFTLTKPYILVGSVVLLVAILFFFTKLPEVQEETDKEEKMIAPVSGTASMWRHRNLSGLLLHSSAIVPPRRGFSVSSLIM